jgi:hypothetical protein
MRAKRWPLCGIKNTLFGRYQFDAIPKVVVRRFGAREIAPRGRRSRAQVPPRTAGLPGRETGRGKEHVGKAEWPEGM